MKTRNLVLILLLLIYAKVGLTQEFSIHPEHKIDTVWYSNVTDESEPEPMSCEVGGVGYFRLKLESEIRIQDYKKDSIKTKKEDWEEADEKEFDEQYNEENKEELKGLEDDFIEEDLDLASLAKEEIDRFVDINWNGYAYNICKNDCESVMEECYIYHEITALKEVEKTYAYRTSFSWLELRDDEDNNVEIDLDLIITNKAWIYFFVTCSCNEIPDLVSVRPSRNMNADNPWSKIDVTGERMKPGYPFGATQSSFPTLPVIGGIIGAGAVVYLLTQSDEEEQCDFTISSTIINTKCGDESGSASIMVSPVGDYSYQWNSGQTGASMQNVPSGTYTVTVTPTDSDCGKTLTVVIDDELLVPLNSVSITNADCGEDNGTVAIDDPRENQTFQWSNGESGTSISGLAPGNYSVTTTTGICTSTNDFVIEENQPEFTISGDETATECGRRNGSISIMINPAGEYDVKWSNGASGSDNSELEKGEYSVTVTLSGTTCSVVETFTVDELAADFELTIETEDASCEGMDGSISVQADQSGDYSYQWSNGASTSEISDLQSGEYSVTVTLMGTECSVSGSATITEKPLDLEITFTTIQPNCGMSDGSVTVNVNPIGTYIFAWSNGDSGQTITDLVSGQYEVTVSDENGCTAIGETELNNVIPELSAINDDFETSIGEPVTGNVLDNDIGTSISVVDHFDENGGMVSISADGNFEFIPQDGFVGDASFQYVIEDFCPNTDTALVTIEVKPVDCTFEVQMTVSDANCGLEDGSIVTTVSPPGNYGYQWSDGSTNSNLENVGAGSYELTITDFDLQCSLIFQEIVAEQLPDYVSNVSVIQPFCAVSADVLFELNYPGANQFLATITHPNGIDAFVIPGGAVFLSDYLVLVTGNYTISVYDTDAGPECTETFSVFIEEPSAITISLIEVTSPTSPTGNDGSAVVEVVLPGTPPYAIWVNGDVWAVTTDNEFTVEGLGVGPYLLFITDETGCTSNELEFFVPPPAKSDFKIGVGLIFQRNFDTEHPPKPPLFEPNYFIELNNNFSAFGKQFSGTIRIMESKVKPLLIAVFRTNIMDFKLNHLDLSFKAGAMLRLDENEIQNPYLNTEFAAQVELNHWLKMAFLIENNFHHLQSVNIGVKLIYSGKEKMMYDLPSRKITPN